MIATDKRKAIYLLHEEGMSLREIARRMHVSRNTVKTIIAQQGQLPQTIRQDKQQIDADLLRRLYAECQGRIQRMHEKLAEEEGIEVTYPTLTRMLREAGISKATNKRCHRVPDEPGVEMQHDTTLYTIALAGKPYKITASILYLRYSKRRYLTFHRGFNRFQMKCALHQALTFWGYAAATCIIDNTNLARLRGTGKAAVINPEMATFAKQYGFTFHCHEIRHANRKAGEERSFWTVETNFLPGRTFESLEDLNQQALQWATERLEHRPQGKAKLIPAKAFEHERPYLIELLAHLPEPYQNHSRGVDQYGYTAFGGNYYWVPGESRADVTVLEYAESIKIYRHRELLTSYPLPADDVRNKPFSPQGYPKPPHGPNNRKRPTQEEEKRLRAMAPVIDGYLNEVLPGKGHGRHRFLRSLLALSRKMTPELFIRSIQRASRYRIEDIQTIERIAALSLQQGSGILPVASVDEHFTKRETYLEGSLTEAPDLTIYQDEDASTTAENTDNTPTDPTNHE
ncbi:MAG: hypothetical protein DHS20C01_38250 [marine bacterium B5-7]|nr:MAG: hypothetical protein DHS20C01_38250 [marine bacterium B5-7]